MLLALVLAAGTAEAANCKRGKPCGGACIARDKVCRIGSTGSTRLVESPRVVEAPVRQTALVQCRWSGQVYRVPAALCTDGGGFVVR